MRKILSLIMVGFITVNICYPALCMDTKDVDVVSIFELNNSVVVGYNLLASASIKAAKGLICGEINLSAGNNVNPVSKKEKPSKDKRAGQHACVISAGENVNIKSMCRLEPAVPGFACASAALIIAGDFSIIINEQFRAIMYMYIYLLLFLFALFYCLPRGVINNFIYQVKQKKPIRKYRVGFLLSREIPKECHSRKIPKEYRSHKIPKEYHSRKIPKESHSRSVLAGIQPFDTFIPLKLTAIITLNCFLWSTILSQPVLAYAALSKETKAAQETVSDIAIPYTAGKITDICRFPGDVLVVNIQDLHCHPEVQRNIARILSSLDKKYSIENIYQEGVSTKADTSWLIELKKKKLGPKIIENLLNGGKLTGAEYFSVNAGRPDIISGLEDAKVYDGNVSRLGKIMEERPAINGLLDDIAKDAETIKNRYYNPNHRALEKIINKYAEGKTSSANYYKTLEKHAKRFNIDIHGYKNLSTCLEMEKIQTKLNYKKAGKHLPDLIAELKRKLPYSAYKAILDDTNNFSDTDIFYTCLINSCRHYNINISAISPQLDDFLKYISMMQGVNTLSLVSEESRLIRGINRRLCATELERSATFAIDFQKCLRDFYSSKMNAEDYEYFSENIDKFNTLWPNLSGSTSAAALTRYHSLFNNYYTANINRNEIFLNKICHLSPQWERIKVRGGSPNIIVTITGGFHSKGLTEALKQKGIPCIVITPAVTQETKYSESVYNKLIQRQCGMNNYVIPVKTEIHDSLAVEALSAYKDTDRIPDVLEALLPLFEGKINEKELNEYIDSAALGANINLGIKNKNTQYFTVIRRDTGEQREFVYDIKQNSIERFGQKRGDENQISSVPKWLLRKTKRIAGKIADGKLTILSIALPFILSPFISPAAGMLPLVFGICDQRYVDWRLEEQRKQEQEEEEQRKKSEEDEKQRQEDEEKRKKEVSEAMEEFIDAIESVVEDDGKIQKIITDSIKHDIRLNTLRALGNLTDSGKFGREAFIKELPAKLVENGVFDGSDKSALEQMLGEQVMEGAVNKLIAKTGGLFRPLKSTTSEKLFEEENNAKSHHAHSHAARVHKNSSSSGFIFLNTLFILIPLTVLTAVILLPLLGGHSPPAELSKLIEKLVYGMTLPLIAMAGAISTGGEAETGMIDETEEDPIKRYTVNLTELAKDGKIDDSAYIDRIDELNGLLSPGSKKNVVITGDPDACRGFIDAVAFDAAKKDPAAVPENLRGREFLYLNVASLLYIMAETGQFEKNIQNLIDAINESVKNNSKKYIFVFDFQHIYWIKKERMNTLSSVSFLFKNILNSRDIPVIGLCNEKHYNEFFSSERETLKNDFEKLDIKNTTDYKSIDHIRSYMRQLKDTYQNMPADMHVTMKKDAMEKMVKYIGRHMPYSNKPGKATEIVDQIVTGKINNKILSYIKLNNLSKKITDGIKKYKELSEKGGGDPERRYVKSLLNGYDKESKEISRELKNVGGSFEVTPDEIVKNISKQTKIPAKEIIQESDDKLNNYVENIRRQLIGQESAVDATYRAFDRRRSGMSLEGKPIGSFIFVGPTGVGKTELAKAIANQYFGDQNKILRFDMSEYSEGNSDQKLIGAPPGYVGYESGGQLTNAVMKNPYSVLLLDEIEKAHSSVYDLLLQVFDKGELTDSHGRKVSFKNTIIIMTSNLGMTPEIYDMYDALNSMESGINLEDKKVSAAMSAAGCSKDESIETAMEKINAYIRVRVEKDGVERFFAKRPELLTRVKTIGDVIVFDKLNHDDLAKILDIKLRQKNEALSVSGIELKLTAELKKEVISKGYDPKNGARPLERALNRLVLAPFSREILKDGYGKGDIITAGLSDDKITFSVEHKNEAVDEGDTLLIKRIDGAFKEGRAADETLAKELFELPDASARAQKITEDKLSLTVPVDADEMVKQFIESQAAQGKAVNADEKKKLKEDLDKKAEEEKKLVDKYLKNLSIAALKSDARRSTQYSENINDIVHVLEQKRRSYPFLVNHSGASLKDFIDDVSYQCVSGNIPGYENARFLKLNLEMFQSQFILIGKIEDQVRRFLDMIEADDKKKGVRTIVVMDYDELEREIPFYRGGGAANGQERFNLGFFMIPFMSRKDVRLIMTTTKDDISNNEVFSRYFTEVNMNNLDGAESLEKFYLSNSGKLNISFSVLEETAKLFARSPAVNLAWEKSEKGSAAQSRAAEPLWSVLERYYEYLEAKNNKSTEALKTSLLRGKDRLKEIIQNTIDDGELPVNTEKLITNEEFLVVLRNIMLLERQLSQNSDEKKEVTISDAYDFLSEKYSFDASNLTVDEKKSLLELEDRLKTKVIGQDEAVNALSDAIRIGKAGLKPQNKPVGAFLFPGPTGVGKTEIAEQLSKELGMPIIKLDMTEYKNPQDVNKLIGSPPGFVGHENSENWLTTKVVRTPKSIILFDEIDKIFENAQLREGAVYGKTVLDVVLQMLEDGRLTDAKGNTADFSQSIIIFTSNGGVNIKEIKPGPNGITAYIDNDIYDEIKTAVLGGDDEKFANVQNKIKVRVDNYHRHMMRPEFLNRLDAIVIFNPLKKAVLEKIVKKFLDEFAAQMADKYQLVFGETEDEQKGIVDALMNKGYSPQDGARGILRLINKDFKDNISSFVKTQQRLKRDDRLIVKPNADKTGFEFKVERSKEISVIEKANLNEIENVVIGNIVNAMNGYEGQYPTLSVKDVEPWLSPVPLSSKDGGKILDFPADTVKAVLNDNDFTKAEPAFMELRKAVSDAVKESCVPAGVEPKEIDKSVKNWLTEAVSVAKCENIQQTAWRNEGRVYDFYNKDTGSVRQIIDRNIAAANRNRSVSVYWAKEGSDLKIEVRFNSAFTKELQRKLFEEGYTSYDTADRLLQGILKANANITGLGAETGYYIVSESETSIWLKFPLPKPPIKESKKAITQAEDAPKQNVDLLTLLKYFSEILGKKINELPRPSFPNAPVGNPVVGNFSIERNDYSKGKDYYFEKPAHVSWKLEAVAENNTVYIKDPSGKIIAQPDQRYKIANPKVKFSPKGKYVAIVDDARGMMLLLDIENNEARLINSQKAEEVIDIGFSPDSKQVIFFYENSAEIFNISDLANIKKITDTYPLTRDELTYVKSLNPKGEICGLTGAPDYKYLITREYLDAADKTKYQYRFYAIGNSNVSEEPNKLVETLLQIQSILPTPETIAARIFPSLVKEGTEGSLPAVGIKLIDEESLKNKNLKKNIISSAVFHFTAEGWNEALTEILLKYVQEEIQNGKIEEIRGQFSALWNTGSRARRLVMYVKIKAGLEDDWLTICNFIADSFEKHGWNDILAEALAETAQKEIKKGRVSGVESAIKLLLKDNTVRSVTLSIYLMNKTGIGISDDIYVIVGNNLIQSNSWNQKLVEMLAEYARRDVENKKRDNVKAKIGMYVCNENEQQKQLGRYLIISTGIEDIAINILEAAQDYFGYYEEYFDNKLAESMADHLRNMIKNSKEDEVKKWINRMLEFGSQGTKNFVRYLIVVLGIEDAKENILEAAGNFVKQNDWNDKLADALVNFIKDNPQIRDAGINKLLDSKNNTVRMLAQYLIMETGVDTKVVKKLVQVKEYLIAKEWNDNIASTLARFLNKKLNNGKKDTVYPVDEDTISQLNSQLLSLLNNTDMDAKMLGLYLMIELGMIDERIVIDKAAYCFAYGGIWNKLLFESVLKFARKQINAGKGDEVTDEINNLLSDEKYALFALTLLNSINDSIKPAEPKPAAYDAFKAIEIIKQTAAQITDPEVRQGLLDTLNTFTPGMDVAAMALMLEQKLAGIKPEKNEISAESPRGFKAVARGNVLYIYQGERNIGVTGDLGAKITALYYLPNEMILLGFDDGLLITYDIAPRKTLLQGKGKVLVLWISPEHDYLYAATEQSVFKFEISNLNNPPEDKGFTFNKYSDDGQTVQYKAGSTYYSFPIQQKRTKPSTVNNKALQILLEIALELAGKYQNIVTTVNLPIEDNKQPLPRKIIGAEIDTTKDGNKLMLEQGEHIETSTKLDDDHVLTAGVDREVIVWNWKTGEILRKLGIKNNNNSQDGHTGSVQSSTRLDDDHVLTTSIDTRAIVWNWRTGQFVRSLGVVNNVDPNKGHTGWIKSSSNLDDDHVLTAGGGNRSIVWNWKTGELVRSFGEISDIANKNSILNMAYTSTKLDDDHVLTGGGDRRAVVWNWRTGEFVRSLGEITNKDPKKGHMETVYSLTKLDEDHVLTTGGRAPIIWNWKTGAIIRFLGDVNNNDPLKGHTNFVFSSTKLDDDYVITCGGDNRSIIWNWRTGKLISSLGEADNNYPQKGHIGLVRTLTKLDNEHVLSAGIENRAIVWKIEYEKEPGLRGKTNGSTFKTVIKSAAIFFIAIKLIFAGVGVAKAEAFETAQLLRGSGAQVLNLTSIQGSRSLEITSVQKTKWVEEVDVMSLSVPGVESENGKLGFLQYYLEQYLQPAEIDTVCLKPITKPGDLYSVNEQLLDKGQNDALSQVKNMVEKSHKLNTQLIYTVEITPENADLAPDAISYWMKSGFDGIRIVVTEPTIITEAYLSKLNNAVYAINPNAIGVIEMDGGKKHNFLSPQWERIKVRGGFSIIRNTSSLTQGEKAKENECGYMDLESLSEYFDESGKLNPWMKKEFLNEIKKTAGAGFDMVIVPNGLRWGDKTIDRIASLGEIDDRFLASVMIILAGSIREKTPEETGYDNKELISSSAQELLSILETKYDIEFDNQSISAKGPGTILEAYRLINQNLPSLDKEGIKGSLTGVSKLFNKSLEILKTINHQPTIKYVDSIKNKFVSAKTTDEKLDALKELVGFAQGINEALITYRDKEQISKITADFKNESDKNLFKILWANRSTIRQSSHNDRADIYINKEMPIEDIWQHYNPYINKLKPGKIITVPPQTIEEIFNLLAKYADRKPNAQKLKEMSKQGINTALNLLMESSG